MGSAIGKTDSIVGLLEQCVCEAWGAMEAFCMNPERRLCDHQFSELVDEFFAANDALNNAVRAGKC
jgi:hypothetical protein